MRFNFRDLFALLLLGLAVKVGSTVFAGYLIEIGDKTRETLAARDSECAG